MNTSIRNGEHGFTLVETLVALIILAISAGILTQTIATSAAKIRGADRQELAELLAVKKMAELENAAQLGNEITGFDQSSGLNWRFTRKTYTREKEVEKTPAELLSVVITAAPNQNPLFRVATIKMRSEPPDGN